MSALTPINSIQTPVLGDVPDIETSFGPAFATIDSRAMARFTTPADRAARVTAPVAGMIGYVASTNEMEYYNGTKWVSLVPRKVIMLSGQTVTDSTTLTNCTQMVFPVEANSVYEFQMSLRCHSTGTEANDLKTNWSMPVGCNGSWAGYAPPGTFASGSVYSEGNMDDHPLSGVWAFGTTSAVNLRVHLHGLLTVGSTAGNFQFQFAENTAIGGVTSVTIDPYTWCNMLKVG